MAVQRLQRLLLALDFAQSFQRALAQEPVQTILLHLLALALVQTILLHLLALGLVQRLQKLLVQATVLQTVLPMLALQREQALAWYFQRPQRSTALELATLLQTFLVPPVLAIQTILAQMEPVHQMEPEQAPIQTFLVLALQRALERVLSNLQILQTTNL
jgi:hypothetical protein